MAYSINNLIADLEGVLHGTTINQITNSYGIYNRAASQLLLDLDPQETIRQVELPSTVYTDVFYYSLPPDLKGNKVIDLKPQVNRTYLDYYPQVYNQAFDFGKQTGVNSALSIQWNNFEKSILISAPFLTPPNPLNYANSLTENGTWVAGGNASTLSINNVNYVAGGGSLQFNLSAGANPSGGYVEVTDQQAVDLSNVVNQSSLFINTFLPTGADFTSISLLWGSSTSDYYSVTATETQQGTIFQDGWNLVAFPWLGATVFGTPDPSSITFVRVAYVYDGSAQTAVKLNNIVSTLGETLLLEYYSKYMFRNAQTGVFQETVTDNTDLVNLDTETRQLFFNLVAFFAVQQQQGVDALKYDSNFFWQQYQEGLKRYRTMYKAQTQKPSTTYYQQPKGNNRYWGGWYR